MDSGNMSNGNHICKTNLPDKAIEIHRDLLKRGYAKEYIVSIEILLSFMNTSTEVEYLRRL